MELHCWWSCAQLGAASYFLGSHNLRFNIPPNLPRALRKGAVSSYPVGVSDRVLYLTRFFFTLPAQQQGTVSYSFLTLPAQPQGTVSYSFLLSSSSSSSGNTSKTYISVMSWSISTRLGHKNPWPCPNLSYNQLGVKGHVGVTGVKKVISLKTLLLLQITGYSHVTHVHASAWPLLQNLWV